MLLDAGWRYVAGMLTCRDPGVITRGLTGLEKQWPHYTAHVDVFERLLDFKGLQEKKARENRRNRQEIERRARELYGNRHALPLPVVFPDLEPIGRTAALDLTSGGRPCLRGPYRERVTLEGDVKHWGWSYSSREKAIVAPGDSVACCRGIWAVCNRPDVNCRITEGALSAYQQFCDQAEEQAKTQLRNLQQSRAVDAEISIPAPEGLAYRGYQRAGVAFAHRNRNVIIGDDMGLGKTIQGLGLINYEKTIKSVLIVCPATAKLSWRDEARKWLTREMSIGVAGGDEFPSDSNIVVINFDILQRHHDAIREREWDLLVVDECHRILNPEIIRTKGVIGAVEKPARTAKKACGLIDRHLTPTVKAQSECASDNKALNPIHNIVSNRQKYSRGKHGRKQFLRDLENHVPDLVQLQGWLRAMQKSYEALLPEYPVFEAFLGWLVFAAAARTLEKPVAGLREVHATLVVSPIQARYRLMMTGTPIENRPKEIWTLLHTLDPQRWPDFFRFALRYCGARETRFGWRFDGAINMDELRAILRSTIMIRREKNEVLDELPGKTRQLAMIPANGLSKDIAREQQASRNHDQALHDLEEARRKAESTGVETSREFMDRLSRLEVNVRITLQTLSSQRIKLARAKLPYIVDEVQRFVDCGQKVAVFAHHSEILRELKRKFGRRAVKIEGATSQAKRYEAVQRFQNEPDCLVFVGSVQAAGLNLTLTAASYAIVAEATYKPGELEQVEDRLYRIGQREPVVIRYLAFEGDRGRPRLPRDRGKGPGNRPGPGRLRGSPGQGDCGPVLSRFSGSN